jgi:hypothetical protein
MPDHLRLLGTAEAMRDVSTARSKPGPPLLDETTGASHRGSVWMIASAMEELLLFRQVESFSTVEVSTSCREELWAQVRA